MKKVLHRPATLRCFVYFQVNSGVSFFLDYVEDISLLVALFAFLQTFDPNILLLLLHTMTWCAYFSCVYITYVSIIDATSALRLLP